MTNLVLRRNTAGNVNPWREMDKLFQDFNRALDSEPRKPLVHIENEDDRVVLTAELPGYSSDDIDVQVKENLLTLKAIDRAKKKKEEDKVAFERSFVLSEDLNVKDIQAEMKNGLLNLVLPRKEKPAPLAIKVKG